MNTFDKLKLFAPINSIRVTDESAFVQQYKHGVLTSLQYHTDEKKPYTLFIKIDYTKNNAVLEFTGKILQSDYPKLISKETIEKCFENINAMGFCEIVTDLMMEAEVYKCDVTKDIPCDDVPKVTSYLKGHIKNYFDFTSRVTRNKNLIISKNVDTKNRKKSITIYDKEKEMRLADNVRFADKYGINGCFDGLCRFEISLDSVMQIKDALRVPDTKLKTVLESEANPIVDFLESAISETTNDVVFNDRKAYMTFLVLKDCKFDLEKVEAKMRSLYKRGTKFSEVMQPYRDMLNQMQQSKNRTLFTNLLDKLR